jgi:hypothetical protein
MANPALATGEPSGVVALDVAGDHGGFNPLRRLEHIHGPTATDTAGVHGFG